MNYASNLLKINNLIYRTPLLWFKGKIKGIIMEDNKPIDGAEYITLEDTKRLKLPYFEGLAPSCTGIIISTDPIAPYGLPSTNTGVRKFLTPADSESAPCGLTVRTGRTVRAVGGLARTQSTKRSLK